MFQFISKHRLHESIAAAAIISASITLHLAWIANILVQRTVLFRNLFNVFPSIGPISGLYLKSAGSFIFFFIVISLWLKGKDCSHFRPGLLRLFYVSIIVFVLMTLPIIYGFAIAIE